MYHCVTDVASEDMVKKFVRAGKKRKVKKGGEKGGRPRIDVDHEEMIKLRRKGKSLKEIARLLSCSFQYVHKHLPVELHGDLDVETGEFRGRLKKGK
jgi:DNA invertase Pin-like site-specific DNA recombinase